MVKLLALLSIILAVLKVAGVLAIGWFVVLLPVLIGFVIIIVVALGLSALFAAVGISSSRSF